MSVLILYLLLLKATVTSFAGLGSLPVIRSDLVLSHHVLTDQQLNAAVAVGRTTPGPAGLYVVSVGYFVAGVPGAVAGWLALITPALLVILSLRFLSKRAEHARIKSMLSAVVLASAGLLLAAAVPLSTEALSGVLLGMIALGSGALLIFTRLDSIWVILAAAAVSLIADGIRIVTSLWA